MADDTLVISRGADRGLGQASGFHAYTPPSAVFNTSTSILSRRSLVFAGNDVLPFVPPAVISGTGVVLSRRTLRQTEAFSAYLPPTPIFSTEGIPAPRVPLPVLDNTDTAQIIFRGGAFVLDFEADDRYGIPPHTVNFTNNSQTPIEIWTWEFGDGNTSNEREPTHTYLDQGLYTVTLRSGSPIFGYARLTKYDYIDTRVLLTIDPLSGKAPLRVSFDINERQL